MYMYPIYIYYIWAIKTPLLEDLQLPPLITSEDNVLLQSDMYFYLIPGPSEGDPDRLNHVRSQEILREKLEFIPVLYHIANLRYPAKN